MSCFPLVEAIMGYESAGLNMRLVNRALLTAVAH